MIDNLKYEKELYEKGYNLICGVDEVGRGPLVGPVVTACVILPENFYDKRINDSKKLSEKKREELYDVIMENAISVGIGMSSEKVIDEINILVIILFSSYYLLFPAKRFLQASLTAESSTASSSSSKSS